MLHYYAKKFFAPKMLSMAVEFNNLTVYLVADNYTERNAEILTLACHSWSSFKPLSSIDMPVPSVSGPFLYDRLLFCVLVVANVF